MDSPEHREVERLAQRAREYREAVDDSTSDAWQYTLLSVMLGILALAAILWSFDGVASSALFFAFMLLMVVAMAQVVMANNIRAWMPEVTREGFTPPRRGYFDALLRRPPEWRQWEGVASAAADRYPQQYAVRGLRGRPKNLTIAEKDGKKWEFYRASYPDVFDGIVDVLTARELLDQARPAASAGIDPAEPSGPSSK